MSEKSNRLQNWADTLTFVCIISLGILIVLWANRPSGMEALGLIFPLLVVGLLHLTLGLLAILAALLTGRLWRNSWIYGYFALLLLCLLAYLGPMRVGQELVRGRIERMTHPAETRLYAAIESASLSDVEEALTEGADPSYCYAWDREYRGRSPLQQALTHRRADLVSRLLAAGADPNLDCNPDKGTHPVLMAAAHLDEESLAALLESGADTNPPGQDRSVLVAAIAGGHYSLPYGAGDAARHRAARDPEKIRSVLLRAGADINQPNRRRLGQVLTGLVAYDPELLDKAIALGGDVNARNTQGGTSLHYLAGCRNCADPVPAMRHLIERGADVEALDASGKTPLEIARLRRVPDTEAFLVSVTAGEGQD